MKDLAVVIATEAILVSIEKWAKAVREDDFASAKRSAEHLVKSGELLAIHPDFQRCFKDHCDGVDPQRALLLLSKFLVCAADGRAKELKQHVRGYGPKVDA